MLKNITQCANIYIVWLFAVQNDKTIFQVDLPVASTQVTLFPCTIPNQEIDG